MSVEDFIKKYPNLPDPKHHPAVVKYYIRLYKHSIQK